MKIAINAIRVSRQSGGGLDHYVINLVNHLAKQNLPFDLFTLAPQHFPSVPKENILHPFQFFKKFSPLTQGGTQGGLVPDPISLQPSSSRSLRSFFARTFGDSLRMAWTQFIFPFFLKSRGYDILFSPSQIDALPFPPSSLKQVITVHDLIPFIFQEQKHKHMFFLNNFFPFALKNSAQIITVSENTKKDLMRLFRVPPEKISVIYESKLESSEAVPSVEEIKKFKEQHQLDKYVLCVSGNDPHKNLPRLVEAFSLIKERTNAALVIAGYQDAKFQLELDQTISKKSLKERVKFLGHVKTSALPLLYSGAEIFVFPSLYEGFGLPPLEAISLGVPVTASNVSSIPEVVGEAAVYFDPYNPSDIADKLLKLLTNENLRLHLKELGLNRSKMFSWEKTASEILSVFQQIL